MFDLYDKCACFLQLVLIYFLSYLLIYLSEEEIHVDVRISLGLVACIFTFGSTLSVNKTASLYVLAKPYIQISSLSLTIDEKSHSQICCVASIPGTKLLLPVFTWFRLNVNISNIKSESMSIIFQVHFCNDITIDVNETCELVNSEWLYSRQFDVKVIYQYHFADHNTNTSFSIFL